MAWNQKRSQFPPPPPHDAEGLPLPSQSLYQPVAPRARMPKLQFSPDLGPPHLSKSARQPSSRSMYSRQEGAQTDRGHYRTSKLEEISTPRAMHVRAKTGGLTKLILPPDWKKDAERLRTAPLPGTGYADFQLSDLRSYAQGPPEKVGQLDNWPSTSTQGSKSWLTRLETFMDQRMEMVETDDVEQSVLACHECFAKFIEDFKNYKPVLSRMYHGYQRFIEHAQKSLRKVSDLEFEMFTLKEQTQEEVRRSHVEAANTLKEMEAALIAAKASETRAKQELDTVMKELVVARDAMEKEKAHRDRLEEVNKAYCSGYKWIMKHVAKADGTSDLDAMETVTLIQKLERAIADSNNSRFQMEYLQRTSEVVLAKTTLEEERRLFGEETERMQTELDNLRHAENAVSRQYRQAKTANEALEEEGKGLKQQLESMFLLHLGDKDDVPALLRTARPIINRQTSREEAAELSTLIFKEALQRYNDGTYPHVEEVLEQVLSDFYHQHNVAEWTRNLIDALEENREVADLALVGGLLAESLGPHALLSRCTFSPDLADRLTALAYRRATATAPDPAASAKPASPSAEAAASQGDGSPTQAPPPPSSGTYEEVAVEDLIAELGWLFRLKSNDHQHALRAFLSRDAVRGQRISIQRIRSESPLGFEEELVELLQLQLVDEIGVMEMRDVILSLEPDKADEDVAMSIWRGFALANYEEAYTIVVPEEEHPEDSGWGRTPSEKAEIPMEPIDRVLYRLSVANLLRRTEPEPLPMPPAPPPRPPSSEEGDAGQSPATPEAEEETVDAATSPMARAPVDVEQGRFKARKDGLDSLREKPIPRWARKGDPGANKPFLTSMVQAFRAKTK